jgi:hypothetical protein
MTTASNVVLPRESRFVSTLAVFMSYLARIGSPLRDHASQRAACFDLATIVDRVVNFSQRYQQSAAAARCNVRQRRA